jgi:hypothetical protein
MKEFTLGVVHLNKISMNLRLKSVPTLSGWWFGTCFPYIGNVIIPTDKLIFFRGVGLPPTSCFLQIFHAFRRKKA